MPQSRQLAAIMFTDIVGYTKLMGEDEQAAFELLKKNRNVQRPIIEKYNGRWLKEIGDGVLASFHTVTDAVYCAATIQKTCENEPHLKLRIGIHLGEVVFEGNDVFGDGVNIASRLEPLAPIGGILVSESVHNNLINKKDVESTYVGEKQLKNVKKPVKVYQIHVKGVELIVTAEPSTSKQETASTTSWNPKRTGIISLVVIAALVLVYFFFPSQGLEETQTEVIDKSIAVLPFKNDSPDADNQYFADGMMDEILNHLQKIAELGVKSRTAVEPYRNSTKGFTAIAQELDVAFVLEGAVRKYGDRFRITTQLIDVASGNHLWSDTYDGVFSDSIFVVQANIAKQIASTLDAVITPEEEKSIDITPSMDVTVYDYMLQAREEKWKYWYSRDTAALNRAEMLYDKVLKLDPTFSGGWALKGEIYWDRYFNKDYLKINYLDSVLWYCDKAVDHDPQNGHSYFLRGMVFHKRGNIDLAIENYERALNLRQVEAAVIWETSWRLGYIYIFRKDVVKGMSLIKKAVQAAKGSPNDYRHMIRRLGQAYMFIGAYEEAEDYLLTAMSLGWNAIDQCRLAAYQGNFQASIDCLLTNCQANFCNHMLANNYLQLRDFETSAHYFQKIERDGDSDYQHIDNSMYREGYALIQMGKQEEGMKLIEQQLSQLEKRKKLRRSDGYDYHLAAIHAFLGNFERALQHLEAYSESVFFLPPNNFTPISFTQLDIMFENLWENEKFKAIVKHEQEEKAGMIEQIRKIEPQGEFNL